MSNYKVLHVGKCKMARLGAMENHMEKRDRVKTNNDIDLQRSELNYAIDGLSAKGMEERVHARVRSAVKRKVRPDAVGLNDIIIGASHDWMMTASKEDRDAYFRDSLRWAGKRYGEENIMYAVVHLDETTPHMHLGICPVKDGCLSSKKMFDKKELCRMHDDFTREVASKYGLERGGDDLEKDGSIETNELKKQTADEAAQGALDAKELLEVGHQARFKPSMLGLSEDRSKVEMPIDAWRQFERGAVVNAKLATQTRAEMVARERAETAAKVAKEEAEKAVKEAQEREEKAQRLADARMDTIKKKNEVIDKQSKMLDEAKIFLDAPDRTKDALERQRVKHIEYEQNLQRYCVREFLKSGRDFAGTVARVSDRLENIGVHGEENQRAYVSACLAEARKQGKEVFQKNKKGKWERRKDKKNWQPPTSSGKTAGGGGGSSWHAQMKDTNFLARLSDPHAVAVSDRLGEVDWDDLTESEKEEKLFWADMFR